MVLDVMVDKRSSPNHRISLDFQVGRLLNEEQSGTSSPDSVTPRRQPPEYKHQEAILPQPRKKTSMTGMTKHSARHGNVISRIRKLDNSTTEVRSQTPPNQSRKMSDVSKASTKSRVSLELPVLTPRRKVSGTTTHLSLRSPSSNNVTMTQMRSTSCPSFAATQEGRDRIASRQRKTRSLSLEPSVMVTAGDLSSKESFHDSLKNPNPISTEQEQNFPDIAENVEESSTQDTIQEKKRLSQIPGPPMHVMSKTRQKLYKAAHSANPALCKYDWRTGDEKLFENYQDLFTTEGRRYINVCDISPEIAEQVLSQQETDSSNSDASDKCKRWINSLPFNGANYGVNYTVEAGFDVSSEQDITDICTNNTSDDTADER